jgi:hypothetical protein
MRERNKIARGTSKREEQKKRDKKAKEGKMEIDVNTYSHGILIDLVMFFGFTYTLMIFKLKGQNLGPIPK